ncbi:MAG: bifunctional (p)ppGpp synthetase/guanosine-3',5'-bis(diphosphate) 3'-pyrophosphohydrolase, partial [Bacteroidales bacterium]|nr:bifunctional (p)ppGpp synthetase/guanosine-3',5'-bis(diphosphate) 3'-pyrophosphohydrolase [Bacteroidales bacterium]
SLFIYSCLSGRFKERPGSVVNYIDNPKDNGYQSFHVQLLNRAGAWEEMHIASERMHRNSRLGCIVERGESWLERFKTVLQNIADSGDGYIFMDGVSSSLYNEDILAFTPQGKGIILPKGATALDFAFEVHTEIGEKAKFARINGALCPIKTELHRGDCVEIGTSDDVAPKPDWLNYAKTYKARRRLHDLLRNIPTPDFKICDKCHPIPGEEVIGYVDATGEVTIHSRHCPEVIKLASENGNSLVSVAFEPDPMRLYPVRIRIVAIDRYHLLRDIIDCFVERQHLSMNKLSTHTEDEIVECIIDFPVHSVDELHLTMESISAIDGVDEVQRII